MNENQLNEKQQKDNPIFVLECKSPRSSTQNSIKSYTLIKSLLNILPDMSSPSSRNQITNSQKSISEMSPSERMNYYTSKLENKKEQYENSIKENIKKIKIIRMKEEKQKHKEEKQKSQKLQQKKEELKSINLQELKKSKQLIQKEKELERLENKEKGWRCTTTRLNLFVDISKSQSYSPNSRNSKMLPEEQSNPPISKRKGSNPDIQNQNIISLVTPNIQLNKENNAAIQNQTQIENKQNDLFRIKSILRQKKNSKDSSVQDISSIHPEETQSQLIKRVGFQIKSQSPLLF